MDRWAVLVALAETQHALVSVAQTRDLGIGVESTKRAVAAHLLIPVRRGVVRVAGAPPSPWEDVMAACLATGDRAVASRRSAGALHGLAVAAPAHPEIVVPDMLAEGLTGADCHRTRRLPPEHCTTVSNVPCTTIELTLVDMAGLVTAQVLASLVDDADRRRLCRPADIVLCLAQITTRGRRGVAQLRDVLDDRVGGASPLETAWLRHLRDADLPAPALQH
ncbi:MAG: hypothetical protein ABIW46_02755, partial [Acidimicrobiales bacterium]